MTLFLYQWIHSNIHGHEKKICIETFRSKEDARNVAISYFPGDMEFQKYIRNNEPNIIDKNKNETKN